MTPIITTPLPRSVSFMLRMRDREDSVLSVSFLNLCNTLPLLVDRACSGQGNRTSLHEQLYYNTLTNGADVHLLTFAGEGYLTPLTGCLTGAGCKCLRSLKRHRAP